jgi:xanthosine utilization system XapX-like protein
MALLGYIAVYRTKGFNQAIIDIQNITLDKMMAKWQNFLIAGIVLGAIYMLKSVKLPANLKLVLVVVGWFIIGYQIALAMDPPGMSVRTRAPAQYGNMNPYAFGGA